MSKHVKDVHKVIKICQDNLSKEDCNFILTFCRDNQELLAKQEDKIKILIKHKCEKMELTV